MERKPRRVEKANIFTRKVDWNLFGAFLEIVECGGVGAAARALNRQQPSLSAALRRLEDHIGARLCERTARGVELTPAGAALYDICVELRGGVNAMPAATARAQGLVEGSVRVLMVSDLVSPAFDRALARFHEDYPAVELRLEVAPWREVVQGLLKGAAEIGAACDSAPSEGLQYAPLTRERQQLYCGPGHPLHGAAPAHPAQYRDFGFVLTGEDEPDELSHFRRRYGLGARMAGFAENLAEARRLIGLGVGVGFLPVDVGAGAGAALWPLLAREATPDYDVYALARPAESLSTPARLLFARLRRAAEEAGAAS